MTGIGGLFYPKYKATISSTIYSNYGVGEYHAWADSIVNFVNSTSYGANEWPPSGLFDKNFGVKDSRTGWNTGSTASPRNIYIRLPMAILLRAYSFEAPSDGTGGALTTDWVLSGSTDGITWVALDSRTNVFTWTAGESVPFIANSTATYNFYRVTSSTMQALGEWRLFGVASSTTETALSVYPPGPLVNYPMNTLAGYPDGNGDYQISASSALPETFSNTDGAAPQCLFDKASNYYWKSAGPYTNWGILGGRYYYSGTVWTPVWNMYYVGEWVQINLPKAISPVLLVITTAKPVLVPIDDQSFVLVASNDGIDWTRLESVASRLPSIATGFASSRRSYFNVSTPQMQSFASFRLIIMDPGTNMTTYTVSVADMEIYGFTSNISLFE